MNELLYKRPPILDSIPSDRPTVLEASAGTGKTYTLKHLVIELLLTRDVTIDQLLVVTFTRRAAAELEVQVRGILSQMLRAFDDPEYEAPRDPARCWTLRTEQKRRITDALNSFDQAQIYTIHSFCQQLLSEYAFHNNQLFDGELVEADWLFEQCFYEVLRTEYANKHASLIKAWSEVSNSYRHDPMTTLRKSLSSLESSTQGLRPEYAQDVLRPHVDDPTLDELVAKVDNNEELETDERRKLQTGIVARFHAAVHSAVERRKATDGLYTYHDMLRVVFESLGCGNLASDNAFLQAVREQFKYALVDEFQDTDQLQWGIFKKIFVDSGEENICYLIGDPKQSIYGFRGADVWTYVDARDEIEQRYGPEAIVTLGRSFRSTSELIDAYDEIFVRDGADAGFFDGDLPIQYKGVACGRPTQACYHSGTSRKASAIELLEMQADGKPKIGEIRDAYADCIALKIRDLLDGDGELDFVEGETGERRRIQPDDIFVLTRRNDDADAIARRLRNYGVPFAFYKRDGLFERAEARDIYTVLRAVVEPANRAWRRAAYLTPFFAIPLEELADQDEFDADHYSPRKLLAVWHTRAERLDFEGLFDAMLTYSGIIRRELLLSDGKRKLTNYRHILELLTREAATHDLDGRQLLARLKELRESRDSLGEDGNVERLESDRAAVQLMTIHKSKGLEAHVVFVYDFNSPPDYGVSFRRRNGHKIFALEKHALNSAQKKELEEYRHQEAQRLHYVAITRAKSKLYLPYEPRGINKARNQPIGHVMRCIDPLLDGQLDASKMCRTPFSADEVAPPQPTNVDWKGQLANLELPDWLTLEEDAREAFHSWKNPDESKKPTDVEAGFKRLRRRRVSMTSYSGLKSKSGSVDIGQADEHEDGDEPLEDFELPEGALPGGTRSGSYLHEILEFIDYSDALTFDDPHEWAAHDDVAEVIDRMSARFGFDAGGEFDELRRAYTERILHRTLRTTIDMHNGPAFRIAQLDPARLGKEVRFVFPVPQTDNFRIGDELEEWVTVRRGYLEGVVDLLFEDDAGRVLFADWKSDTPQRGFAPEVVEAHVDQRYPLQARIYTMAVCRMFDIQDPDTYDAKFGGYYYFFVRGMRDGSADGIYYGKPSWEEVVAVEEKLETCDDQQWKAVLELSTDEIKKRRGAR